MWPKFCVAIVTRYAIFIAKFGITELFILILDISRHYIAVALLLCRVTTSKVGLYYSLVIIG